MSDAGQDNNKNTNGRIQVITSHLLLTSSPKLEALSSSMASEKQAAIAAANTPTDAPTMDINPQAPIHILIIPKVKDGLSGLSKAEERHFEILGRLLYTAKVIAKQEGLDDGFRIVINDGPLGCQSVYHIHVHLLGGRQMNWPAG